MTSPQSALVLVNVDRGVALITWNRPDRHNAWTLSMEAEYFQALRDAEADPAVRVIVVTGAGRSFCPGMDANFLDDMSQGHLDTRPQDRTPSLLPTTLKTPVIAAINGACAGLGLVHALFCDIRFAASGAKFSTAFARRGIMAEQGISWALPKVVGFSNAMELLLSARTFTTDEALRIGLVNRSFEAADLLPATLDYAAELAQNCSPLAMATIKQQLHHDTEKTLDQSRIAAIDLWNSTLKPHPDFAEGIKSLVSKTTPSFGPWPPREL
ncbi:enoyl-CoA hydratase-related protein [Nocardioides sp. WS12]|uniref:enoyl-CoA hydratase-related protein n=1 Tax=Nocardioides sp. WS12 TaxID=2486272 RepID=UPI0015FB3091|nr:enoyl-CoA hydratase-related protein [Nocardioides sp. WS12]